MNELFIYLFIWRKHGRESIFTDGFCVLNDKSKQFWMEINVLHIYVISTSKNEIFLLLMICSTFSMFWTAFLRRGSAWRRASIFIWWIRDIYRHTQVWFACLYFKQFLMLPYIQQVMWIMHLLIKLQKRFT